MPVNTSWYTSEPNLTPSPADQGDFMSFPRGKAGRLQGKDTAAHVMPKAGRTIDLAYKTRSPALSNRSTYNWNTYGVTGTRIPIFPASASYATCCNVGYDVYSFGGIAHQQNTSFTVAQMWKTEYKNRKHTYLGEFPIKLSYSSSAESGGIVYVWAGWDATAAAASRKLYSFDPATRTVTLVTDNTGPSARYGCTMVAIAGKLYLHGGYVTSDTSTELWEYDIAGNTWTQKTSGATKRLLHAACVYNSKMYVHGGTGNAAAITTPVLYDMWEYSPANDTWTQKQSDSSSYPKVSHRLITIGDYACACFGYHSGSNYYNRVYSFANNTWSLGAYNYYDRERGIGGQASATEVFTIVNAVGTYMYNYDYSSDVLQGTYATNGLLLGLNCYAGAYCPSMVWNGKIILGPAGAYNATGWRTTDRIYILDPMNNTVEWSAGYMPGARYYASGTCLIGDNVYVYGGFDGAVSTQTLYVYNLISQTWATLASDTGPVASYPELLSYQGNLYLFNSSSVVRKYTVATDTWSAMNATFPDNGWECVTAIVGDRAYFVGGVNGQTRLRYYDFTNDSFTTLANRTNKCGYNVGRAILEPDGNSLFIITTHDGSVWTATAWKLNLTTLVETTMPSAAGDGEGNGGGVLAAVNGAVVFLYFQGSSGTTAVPCMEITR